MVYARWRRPWAGLTRERAVCDVCMDVWAEAFDGRMLENDTGRDENKGKRRGPDRSLTLD